MTTKDRIGELDEAMDDDTRARLIQLRGGCSCCVSPPCSACCNPLTEEEAIRLGLLTEIDSAPAPALPMPAWDSRAINTANAMDAVRSMCRGN
jgi:hypothetical protein